MENYSQYFNKGNDCDICKHQFLCGIDGDKISCHRLEDGEECEYVECEG